MPLTLHWFPDYASLVIRLALEEIGAPYDAIRVDTAKGEHRAYPYRALNPRGLIPVLEDSDAGAVLFETGAILLYLADAHGRLAPPQGRTAERADLLKWLFLLANTVHADARAIFYPDRYIGAADAASLQTGVRARVLGHFALIDEQIDRSGGPWLLGAELSVCDFYLGCIARWCQIYPRGRGIDPAEFERLPHLAGLLRKLQALPSVSRSLEIEGIDGPAFLRPKPQP